MEQSVGKPIEQFDSHDKVTGKVVFPGDINFTDQVFMHTLFSPFPHAIIRQIEFADVQKVPGVIAVLTTKDVPA
jgi:CO/xanthine dehydrogenase Mo-binding subunit